MNLSIADGSIRLMAIPRFGLNRFDSRSVDAFAADVQRAEQLGWDAALQPDSQLRRCDTYVLSRGRRVSENRRYVAYDPTT
jgi:hypothetical protein